MHRYLFLFEDYPLGQIQFDEKKGDGSFSYCLTSAASDFINIKPSAVIELLEEIRVEASSIKTIGEFQRYVASSFGRFSFKPLKGYE